MAKQRLRSEKVWKLEDFNDQLTPAQIAAIEGVAVDLQDFMQGVISQINQIVGKTNWFDAPSTDLEAIATAGPTGPAGGDLSGTYPNPEVSALTETSGPTQLILDAILDGQFIQRDGTDLKGTTVETADFIADSFTATAGQVSFILSQTPADIDSIHFEVNGVSYKRTISWTISGTTITWLNNDFAMVGGDRVCVKYADAVLIGAPSDFTDPYTPVSGTFQVNGAISVPGGTDAEQFGRGANASGTRSFAAGNDATASGIDSTAIGENSLASKNVATAVGADAVASGNNGSSAFGQSADATGELSAAIGALSLASGSQATAVGQQALATGASKPVAVGRSAICNQSDGVALGANAACLHSGSLALGQGSITTGTNRGTVGSAGVPKELQVTGGFSAFNATPPAVQPSITGSRGGNAALASLLTALAATGLIIDNTTP